MICMSNGKRKTWKPLWAHVWGSRYQDPQQGTLRRADKIRQTRFPPIHPRRSPPGSLSTPQRLVGSPSLWESRQGHLLRGTSASSSRTGQSNFSSTWSHRRPGLWLHWSPQSQCLRRGRLCEPWWLKARCHWRVNVLGSGGGSPLSCCCSLPQGAKPRPGLREANKGLRPSSQSAFEEKSVDGTISQGKYTSYLGHPQLRSWTTSHQENLVA